MPLSRFGALPEGGGTRFRVWAPKASRVDLVLEGEDRTLPLEAAGNGTFERFVEGVGAGTRYRRPRAWTPSGRAGTAPSPWRPPATAPSRGPSGASGRGCATGTGSTAATPSPTRPRGSSPRASTAPPRSWTRRPTTGRTTA